MLKNAIADDSMWDSAVRDLDAESHAHVVAKATVALSGTWPFLAAAASNEEFEHRLALMAGAIEKSTPPEVLGEVVAGLRDKFTALHTARLATRLEARTAARTVALAEGQVSLPDAFIHVHSHKTSDDDGEYWQVDHVASPSMINTIGHLDSRDDALQAARQYNASAQLPLYENGKHVEGRRQLDPAQYFFHQASQGWLPAKAAAGDRPGDEHLGPDELEQQEYDQFHRSPDWELNNIHKALNMLPFLNTPRDEARLRAVKRLKDERRGRKGSLSFRDGMPGMGNGWTADLLIPQDWDGTKWVPGQFRQGSLQATAHQQWRAGGSQVVEVPGMSDAAGHARMRANWGDSHNPRQATNYQPDPNQDWRYRYPVVPAAPPVGGQPTGPTPGQGVAQPETQTSVGPDGFPLDVAAGEYDGAAAKMQQVLTPGAWVAPPGGWPAESMPNAATGLPQGQYRAVRKQADFTHTVHAQWPRAGADGGSEWTQTHASGEDEANRLVDHQRSQGASQAFHRPMDFTGSHTASGSPDFSRRVAAQHECDIHKYEMGQPGVPAKYDGKTVYGPWANMCEEHARTHGVDQPGGPLLRPLKEASRQGPLFYLDEVQGARRMAGVVPGDDMPSPEHFQQGHEHAFTGAPYQRPRGRDKAYSYDQGYQTGISDRRQRGNQDPLWYVRATGARHTAGHIKRRPASPGTWCDAAPPGDHKADVTLYQTNPTFGDEQHLGSVCHRHDTGEQYFDSYEGSRRQAGEGAVPTPGPNPNYFSQGTQGIQGPAEFPEDPSAAIEPKDNNRVDDFYGGVPPQVSPGSSQGQVDGQGYSRSAARGDYPHMTIHPAQSYNDESGHPFSLHEVRLHAGPEDSFTVGHWPAETVMDEAANYGWQYAHGHGQRGVVPVRDVRASLRTEANKYIKQQDGKWVITQKGTGKVLSHHDSEEDAEASFRAMMQSKHGSAGAAPGFSRSAGERTAAFGDEPIDNEPWDKPNSAADAEREYRYAPTGPKDPERVNRDLRQMLDGMGHPRQAGMSWGESGTPQYSPELHRRQDEPTPTAPAQSMGRTTGTYPELSEEEHAAILRGGWKPVGDPWTDKGLAHGMLGQEPHRPMNHDYMRAYDWGTKHRMGSQHQAGTDGRIVGMCDHCNKPVRYHTEDGGHLRHLHNGAAKCSDGKVATAMVIDAGGGYQARFKLPPFVAASPSATNWVTIQHPEQQGQPITATCRDCGPLVTHPDYGVVSAIANDHQVAHQAREHDDLYGQGAHERDFPSMYHGSQRQGAVLENPSQDNPTGRGGDPYRSKTTWEGFEQQRPRQKLEGPGGMNANTPTTPGDPIHSGPNINTPNPGSPLDENGPRERGDEDESDDDDDD